LETPFLWNANICNQLGLLVDKDLFPYFKGNQIFTTPRDAMQYIGTSVLRESDYNFHIDKTLNSLTNQNYIFDDCRFSNELEALKDKKAINIFVIRPSMTEISNHESEIDLRWTMFDYILINNQDKLNKNSFSLNELKHNLSDDHYFLSDVNSLSAEIAGLLARCERIINKYCNTEAFEHTKSDLYIKFVAQNSIIFEKLLFYIKENNLLEINLAEKSIICRNPFIIENLKLWNLFNTSIHVPEIVGQRFILPNIFKYTNYSSLLSSWLTGFLYDQDQNKELFLIENLDKESFNRLQQIAFKSLF